MTAITAQVSSRTTACCSGCDWTSERLTAELPIRTAARQHIGATGHPVTLLTNTVTLLEQQRVPVGELDDAEHHSGAPHTPQDIVPRGPLGAGPLPSPRRKPPQL